MRDLSVLDQLIIGRVDPHIYAFTTNTIPNYLKVGDTYRPVAVRLQEWREHFPNLQKEYEHIAKVSDDIYFRDYAVHSFLEGDRHRSRLLPSDIAQGVYYSREFFKDTSARDLAEAVDDIQRDYDENTGKYQFYSAETRLPETYTYERTESYPPRPNQDKTIQQFIAAVENGRTNLLMYAVMRFGKSFTSMCCATEISANIVVVVSAKADVKEEWKKTVESHVRFEDYDFLAGNQLLENENAIRDKLDAGRKVVVFLTLQDLQGETIKEKHREIFGREIDLLIVDETHFGARAEKYGRVLRAAGKQHSSDTDDFVEAAEAAEQMKYLDARIRLHLSGTPYRILMGSEFSKEDIIAFYQFTDIVKDQEQWIQENNAKAEAEQKEEWENPYYGFPQMIRFAFNPNESSRRRLKELRDSGVSFAFSALLKPKSIKKADDGSHKQFVFEQEILDFLSVIDGSKDDDELLGFLDYEKIKSGNMCRHIVCVLPYCASCDAMETLIRSHADTFRNLGEYEIINISGVDQPNAYRSPADIKRKIQECEEAGRKTLTLTVNRMLTGSTVEQWDTMLFLKDTASPQEYDQAIFRLQNQFIKRYMDDAGHIIKYDMKPQTLLVDFMPDRMFRMQEQKSQIYNVNVDEAGNSRLEDRIREELRVSPIIVMNSDKMEQVQASDILHAVSEYSKTRGVAEETAEIPVDLSLMDIAAIRAAIEQENELGSKAGFSAKAHEGEGEGSDLDTPEDGTGSDTGAGSGEGHGDGQGSGGENGAEQNESKKDPIKQFRSYYARILFFAFLTRDTLISLEEIIAKMDAPENARIARNIGISKPILEAIQGNINKFILRDLDYKIHNLNKLSHDDTVDPIERASVAVRKFGKLGESEVITPKSICEDMIALIPDEGFTSAIRDGQKILDIAGKAGEFALAVYERLKRLGFDDAAIRNSICTIPTSGITYEFTRMVYEILGLNVACLADKFTAYDLLEVKNASGKIDYEKIAALLTQAKPFNTVTLHDTVAEGDEKVKFDVVVGNPPYQESTTEKSAQSTPIYDKFVRIAKSISPDFISYIIPSRWFAGGMGLDDFRNYMVSDKHISHIISYANGKECFPDSSTGGLCIFVWNSDYSGDCLFATKRAGQINKKERDLSKYQFVIRDNIAVDIMEKVECIATEYMSSSVASINAFGFVSKCRGAQTKTSDEDYELISSKGIGFVSKEEVTTNIELANRYKVIVSQVISEHAAEPDKNGMYKLLSSLRVLKPKQICTFSYLVVSSFDDEESAIHCAQFLSTKFARFLLLQAVSSIHLTKDKFMFVPVQDFSKPWTDEDLYAKYHLTPDEIAFIEATIKPME